jgi:AcrR family transcriptional regulator
MKTKDETYWKILNSAISLDITKGHLKWTISELARKTDIQRPLIYYYFGKEKLNILLEACHLFGKIYAGISPDQKDKFANQDYFNGVKFARDTLKTCPNLAPFYFLNRGKDNEISKLIKHYHNEGLNMRLKDLEGDETLAKAIFAFQMGMVLFDDLDDHELLRVTHHIGSMRNDFSDK